MFATCLFAWSQNRLYTTKANVTFYWSTDTHKVHLWSRLDAPQPWRLEGFTLVDSFISTPNGELAIDLYFWKADGVVPPVQTNDFEPR
jgi:hypothetical protein